MTKPRTKTKNLVESKVYEYWVLSLAWRGFKTSMLRTGSRRTTVGDILTDLNPLICQCISPLLSIQAAKLSSSVVKGRPKRFKRKCKVINLQEASLKLKTKKVGQKNKLQAKLRRLA